MPNSDAPFLTPDLVTDLLNPEYWAHQKAVRVLLEQGFPGPACPEEMLFQRLRQHVADVVRKRAAMILGGIPDQRASDALSRALQDRIPAVRLAAARALVTHGERVASQVGLPLLDDPNPHIRLAAMQGLGTRLQTEPYQAQEKLTRIIAFIVTQTGRVTHDHLAVLLAGLHAPLVDTRVRCIGALSHCAAQANEVVPPLIACLADPDAWVRCRAIDVIVHLGGDVPYNLRQRLLHDKATRTAAARALGRQGDAEAIVIIGAALQAEHEFDRENAVSWLRTGYHTGATIRDIVRHLPMSLIITTLSDPYWPVSYPWAECVATLGADVPFAQIEALLQHTEPEVRSASLHVLACCDVVPPIAPPFALLDDPEVRVRRDAVAALLAFDVPVERLLPYLEQDDPAVAIALAQRGSSEAVEILLALLAHGDDTEQWQAANALTKVSVPLPSAPLLYALGEDDYDQVCVQVLDVLARQPAAMAALTDQLPAIITTLEGGQRWSILDDLFAIRLVGSLRGLVEVAPTMQAYAISQLASTRSSIQYSALMTLRQLPAEARQRVAWLQVNSPSVHVRKLAHNSLERSAP